MCTTCGWGFGTHCQTTTCRESWHHTLARVTGHWLTPASEPAFGELRGQGTALVVASSRGLQTR